jgi:hypothetical protein
MLESATQGPGMKAIGTLLLLSVVVACTLYAARVAACPAADAAQSGQVLPKASSASPR